MSEVASTEQTQASDPVGEPARGMSFISIAFVMAISLSPVVIATGLLTDPTPAPRLDTEFPDISIAALRPSFDTASWSPVPQDE